MMPYSEKVDLNSMTDLKQYVITHDCKYYNIGDVRPNNIFLIGLMGSGKTTLSKELSSLFGYKLINMDNLDIEEVFNRQIVKELHGITNKQEQNEIFNKLLLEYSENLQNFYLQQHNSLIEGLQPLDMDERFWVFFKNQSILVKTTSFTVSTIRAIKRDSGKNIKHWYTGNYDLLQKLKRFEMFLQN